MATIRGFDLPDDLHYLVDKHVWARRMDDGSVRIGLTDVAQHLAKKVIVVRPKGVGKTLARAQSAGTVESGKWVGPVPAPVAGEVVAVNDELVATPSLLNEDPYGRGWLLALRPSAWETDAAQLASGADGLAAYEKSLEGQGLSK